MRCNSLLLSSLLRQKLPCYSNFYYWSFIECTMYFVECADQGSTQWILRLTLQSHKEVRLILFVKSVQIHILNKSLKVIKVNNSYWIKSKLSNIKLIEIENKYSMQPLQSTNLNGKYFGWNVYHGNCCNISIALFRREGSEEFFYLIILHLCLLTRYSIKINSKC